MILTAVQVFEFARNAGAPPIVAVSMTAIAKRESAYDPSAHNANEATGDDSYGLWQINLKDPGIRAVLYSHGIGPRNLLDPATNAKAYVILWAGKDRNLSILSYIDHGGAYQARYEAALPEAQAAALSSPLGL